MFENIMNFFKNLGKKEEKSKAKENSKDAAKERLHLVLMQDRANVSADFLELMKQEIIDVIKKYIEIDEKEIDVRLTNKENEDGTNGAPALYANIPILNIKNDTRKINKKNIEEKQNKEEQHHKKEAEEIEPENRNKETENAKQKNKNKEIELKENKEENAKTENSEQRLEETNRKHDDVNTKIEDNNENKKNKENQEKDEKEEKKEETIEIEKEKIKSEN